uniref:RING-type E3 ubiquitin transferase n=1 Tax=Opuntia streptacantha TaxID=393608 RepID=A0A7C8YBJ8_OPUST
MATAENLETWAPDMNPKDCTQGFCILHEHLVFPPPPPFAFPDDHDASQSGSSFSPLVIAIIGILASAFLLISYYALISKYCGNSASTRAENNQHSHQGMEEEDQNLEPSHHEPWLMSTNGLDEALIKAITLVKYKKDDGLVGISSMCSICLGEILEDDTLRLLPKCSHAFHVPCIDTWLRSHSNCPLCRANIVSTSAHPSSPPQLMVDIIHQPDDHQNQLGNGETRSSEEGRETGVLEQASGNSPKCPFRAFSDLGEVGSREITVTDAGDHGSVGGQIMRRSISMDHPRETHLSVSEILRFGCGEDYQLEDCQAQEQHPKEATGESSKASIAGSTNVRFLFCKHGRGRNSVIPV